MQLVLAQLLLTSGLRGVASSASLLAIAAFAAARPAHHHKPDKRNVRTTPSGNDCRDAR